MTVEREVIKVIGDVLKSQLNLDDEHILLAYEKNMMPDDSGLYIALSYISGKAIGNNKVFNPDTDQEEQSVTMHELIQIDALSFGSAARTRKEEIIAALGSVASEQAQELNQFQIARIPGDFFNASSLEETKYLNRFTMTIAVTALISILKSPPFFDTFQNVEVLANG